MSESIKSRELFIKWIKLRRLDPTEDKDAWGGPIFKHKFIQAMWEGWVAFGQYGLSSIEETQVQSPVPD